MTQWDFQNKGMSGWTGKSFFVLEVPLRHLRPSVIYSVPCDRILQKAYSNHSDNINLKTVSELFVLPRNTGNFGAKKDFIPSLYILHKGGKFLKKLWCCVGGSITR